MKHTPFFYRLPHLAILVLLLSCIGCAPIRTNVRSSHPPRLEGSTVLVYELTDSLPAAAEVLGDLRIKDFEPWIGYRYDELIEVLGKETNRHGGNAIRLTSYKEPSYYGSAGNRIAADMCLLEDSVYTASYFINLATQQAYAKLRNEADRKHLSGKTSFNVLHPKSWTPNFWGALCIYIIHLKRSFAPWNFTSRVLVRLWLVGN